MELELEVRVEIDFVCYFLGENQPNSSIILVFWKKAKAGRSSPVRVNVNNPPYLNIEMSVGEFYRRVLPETCVDLAAAEGRSRFASSLSNNGANCFFSLIAQVSSSAK